MYIFVPNKSFGQLYISHKNHIFLKTFDSGFSYIEVSFTDQNSKPLEIEDKINTILVLNYSIIYKKWHTIQSKKIFVKGYEFLCFTKKKGKNIEKKISKSWNRKYNQKLPDNAKQSATGAFKTSSRKVIQKTAEATSDLIGNKIADKIIRASKTSPENNLQTNEEILRE